MTIAVPISATRQFSAYGPSHWTVVPRRRRMPHPKQAKDVRHPF